MEKLVKWKNQLKQKKQLNGKMVKWKKWLNGKNG